MAKGLCNDDESVWISKLSKNGLLLEHAPYQTEEMCRVAITENPAAFTYIKNKTKALTTFYEELWCCTPDFKLGPEPEKRIQGHGLWLKHVHKDNQTKEMCAIALAENPLSLEFFGRTPTREQAREAVKRDWLALKYDPYQEYSTRLLAVSNNGRALQHCHYQDENLCLHAVVNCGYALRYVKRQTEAICIAAVTQNGRALQFVEKQTPKIVQAALEQWPQGAKQYVID